MYISEQVRRKAQHSMTAVCNGSSRELLQHGNNMATTAAAVNLSANVTRHSAALWKGCSSASATEATAAAAHLLCGRWSDAARRDVTLPIMDKLQQQSSAEHCSGGSSSSRMWFVGITLAGTAAATPRGGLLGCAGGVHTPTTEHHDIAAITAQWSGSERFTTITALHRCLTHTNGLCLLLLLLLLQTNPADVEPPKLLVVDVDLVKVRLQR
jgi:hypothetical protein